jgi:hypothetical protein
LFASQVYRYTGSNRNRETYTESYTGKPEEEKCDRPPRAVTGIALPFVPVGE